MNRLQNIPSFAVVWAFYVATTLGIFTVIRLLLNDMTLALCAVVLWQAPGIFGGIAIGRRFDEWRYANNR